MWKYAFFISCFVSIFFGCTAGRSGNHEFTAPPNAEKLQGKVTGRIVNGTKAILGQFPQQVRSIANFNIQDFKGEQRILVSLRRRYSQQHFCGGSILTPDWVLTAGHCMFAGGKIIEAYTMIVVAGEIDLRNTAKAHQWSYVSERIVHPHFNAVTLRNDVTLLKLKEPFVFDPFVKPAPVMRDAMVPFEKCRVSGWGSVAYDRPGSPDLLFVDLPLLPISLCRKFLRRISLVPPGMICAGYVEGGRDACQGDSGGGMLCGEYLTGVVSGGEGCAWPELPGLYADVRYYLPWIESYVELDRNYSIRAAPFRKSSASILQSTFLFVILLCFLPSFLFNI